MAFTTAVGSTIRGRFPPDLSVLPGPRGYITARYTNYLAENWSNKIGRTIVVAIQPSPLGMEYLAQSVKVKNVQPIRIPAGTIGILKPYIAQPVACGR